MENLLEHLASKISLLTIEFFLTTRLIRWTLSLFFFQIISSAHQFLFSFIFHFNQSVNHLFVKHQQPGQ